MARMSLGGGASRFLFHPNWVTCPGSGSLSLSILASSWDTGHLATAPAPAHNRLDLTLLPFFSSWEPFEPCRARGVDAAPSSPYSTGGLMVLRLCQPHAGTVKLHSSSPAVNHTRAFP